MTVNMNSTGMSDLVQIISEQGMAGLGGAFQVLLNQAMLIERDRYLGAAIMNGLKHVQVMLMVLNQKD